MKPLILIGVLLIALGALGLILGEITYVTERETVSVGPLQATVKEEKTIPTRPLLGGLAIAAGVVLLMAGRRKTQT